jgi:hypothetical protein
MLTDQELFDRLDEVETQIRKINAQRKALVKSIEPELEAIRQRIEPELKALRERKRALKIRCGNLLEIEQQRGGYDALHARLGIVPPSLWMDDDLVFLPHDEAFAEQQRRWKAKWLTNAQQAAEPETDYFGVCPTCHKNNGYLNIGRQHWFVCHEHRVTWCVGENLFSSWREQSEETFAENAKRIADYAVVEPYCGPESNANPAATGTDHGIAF